MAHPPTQRVTRLAPSPTGALHLGNARTFLVNWALARQQGWRVVLRIEDLDGPRVKPGADSQAITDLAWLGMDWDEGPVYQRADLSVYEDALRRLEEQGLTYRCDCTRRDIESAQSAPHGDGHELRYPGTCRDRPAGDVKDGAAVRVRVPDEGIAIADTFAGEHVVNVQHVVGDFVVATKEGLPAYQLAVVVDDHRQGVTDVVRGDDLISSAARQVLLYRLLGLAPLPAYTHLPLVLGDDGRRLAKRHGDTRVASYREAGVPAERLIGLVAYWCGVLSSPAPLCAAAFVEGFDLRRLGHDPITFTKEHDAWLTAE